MKNQELFDRTVGILVKAYFNNTLERENCYACAVGNIVAENMGWDIVKTPRNHQYSSCLNHVIADMPYHKTLVICLSGLCFGDRELTQFQLEQLKSTGYSYHELSGIERAFENSSKEGDKVYNGLMSVVDYLMTIHKASKIEITQAKSLFKKELAEVG